MTSAAFSTDLTPALIATVRDVRLVAFDFDGVFTDNMVYVSEEGAESVRCSRSDGLGLRKLEAAGVTTVIISTEKNPVVRRRSEKLKITCHHGVDDKLSLLNALMDEQGVTAQQTAFVGNDINDLECLTHVGLPVVVADAHPDVASLGRYRTQRKGGEGAVREVCDLIAWVKQDR